jgi:hypothetical protein
LRFREDWVEAGLDVQTRSEAGADAEYRFSRAVSAFPGETEEGSVGIFCSGAGVVGQARCIRG